MRQLRAIALLTPLLIRTRIHSILAANLLADRADRKLPPSQHPASLTRRHGELSWLRPTGTRRVTIHLVYSQCSRGRERGRLRRRDSYRGKCAGMLAVAPGCSRTMAAHCANVTIKHKEVAAICPDVTYSSYFLSDPLNLSTGYFAAFNVSFP